MCLSLRLVHMPVPFHIFTDPHPFENEGLPSVSLFSFSADRCSEQSQDDGGARQSCIFIRLLNQGPFALIYWSITGFAKDSHFHLSPFASSHRLLPT